MRANLGALENKGAISIGTEELPLPLALAYAADIAAGLRDLHARGRVHGAVSAAAVALDAGRAVLGSETVSGRGESRDDITAFGALLSEMIGARNAGDAEEVRKLAELLVARCVSGQAGDMQKVLTELRLLKALAAQRRAPALGPEAFLLETPPQAAEEPAPVKLPGQCPRCGSAHVFLSSPRTPVEEWLQRVRRPVRRCHRCDHRYVVFFGMKFTKSLPPLENMWI